MRVLPALTAAALAAVPAASTVRTKDDAELARATAGRTAGKPIDCIARNRTDDFAVVGSAMIFRQTSRTTYVNRLSPGCDKRSLRSTLVFRSPSSQLCRGEIVEAVDPQSGVTWGSCTVGQFVPYDRP